MSPSALRALSLKGLLIFATGAGTIATAAHLLIPRKSTGGRRSSKASPTPTLLEKEIAPQIEPDTSAPEPIAAPAVPNASEPKEEAEESQPAEEPEVDYDALSDTLRAAIILSVLEKFQNSCPHDKSNIEGLRHFFSNVQRLNDALARMKEEQRISKKP